MITSIQIDGKPNNRCITCEYFGTICTGTNPLAMIDPDSPRPLDRLGEFCRLIKERRQNQDPKWTNQFVADQAGVSKPTVDRFFAGYTEDIKLSTLVRIYKVLLDGKWEEIPCSLEGFDLRLSASRAELEEKNAEIEQLRLENQSLEKKLNYALEDVELYKEQAEKNYAQMLTKDSQLQDRKSALNYRGRIIIFLIILCVIFCALAIYGLTHEAIWVG